MLYSCLLCLMCVAAITVYRDAAMHFSFRNCCVGYIAPFDWLRRFGVVPLTMVFGWRFLAHSPRDLVCALFARHECGDASLC